MKVGILLSEEATHRLSDIYNKSAKLSKAEKDSLLSLGLAGKNPTFDDFYIALYLLSLLGKGNHVKIEAAQAGVEIGKRRPVLDFEVISNLLIGYAKEGATFEETILDEFVVADAYDLRQSIGHQIPLVNFVSEAALGCFYARFTILADPHRVPNGHEPSSFNKEIVATSPGWRALMGRYNATYHTQLLAH